MLNSDKLSFMVDHEPKCKNKLTFHETKLGEELFKLVLFRVSTCKGS